MTNALFFPSKPSCVHASRAGLNLLLDEFVRVPKVGFTQDAVTDRAELRGYAAKKTWLVFLQPETQDLFGVGIGDAGPEKFFISLSDFGVEAYAHAPVIRPQPREKV